MDYRAYLISGTFGPGNARSNHHWVAILAKEHEANELIFAKEGIYVDGTVDQYREWRGLSTSQRSLFGATQLLISYPDDQTETRDFYHDIIVSPAPQTWFSGEKES